MTFQTTHARLVSITCAQCDARYNDGGFEWFGDLDTARWAAESDYWRELDESVWLCPAHADNPPEHVHPSVRYRIMDDIAICCDAPDCTRVFHPEYITDDPADVVDQAEWCRWVGMDGGRHLCPEHAKPGGDAYRTTYDSTKQGMDGEYGHVR